MDSRKEELERKRQKLAEIRKARENRKSEVSAQVDSPSTTVSKQNVDDLVASLVGSKEAIQTETVEKPAPQVVKETPIKSKPVLSISKLSTFDIFPEEKIAYHKECQTTETYSDDEKENDENAVDDTNKSDKPANKEVVKNPPAPAAIESKELPEEDKAFIISSETFASFFEKSTKLIERALEEKYDYLKDYSTDVENGENYNKSNKLFLVNEFYDEKRCKNRVITSSDWSYKHKELMLAAYNRNASASYEKDGLVLIWNMHLKNRPEFIFSSQSDVICAQFSPFHPCLIIGGTYSGQIQLWDTRSKSNAVLKSPLSTGHTHPVFASKVIGTNKANELVTASSDGTVCTWQLDMLSQPQDIVELSFPTNMKTEEVTVKCLDFPQNESNVFLTGTEEGKIYQGNRIDRAGLKAGLCINDVYQGHLSPITSIKFHPCYEAPFDASSLFLSSSMDWSVKLWKAQSISKVSSSPTIIQPIHSFETATDCVYDVAWHPCRPHIFSSADGSGNIDLWDLINDVEVPLASLSVSPHALNKIVWDRQQGQYLCTGGSDGKLYTFELDPQVVNYNSDDWSKFQKSALKNQQ